MNYEANAAICQSQSTGAPAINSAMDIFGAASLVENTTTPVAWAPLTDALTNHSEEDHAEVPRPFGDLPMGAVTQAETKEVFPETNTEIFYGHDPLGEDLLQRLQEVLATALEDHNLEILYDVDDLLRPWIGEETSNSQTKQRSTIMVDSLGVIKEIFLFFAEEKYFHTYDANLPLVFDRVSFFVHKVREQHLAPGAISIFEEHRDDITELTQKLNNFSYYSGILDGLYRESIMTRITGVSSEEAMIDDVTYDECPVCQNFEIRAGNNFVLLDNCKHLFCKSCLEQWLKEKWVDLYDDEMNYNYDEA